MSKYRNWCFTINNPEESDDPVLDDRMKYVKWQLELGVSGTPHYQGLVIMNHPCRMATMKELFPRAHLEPMISLKGSMAYVEKQEGRVSGPWELGEKPKAQGSRTDLAELTDRIVDGGITSDQLAVHHPELYHQYGRTFHKVEDITLRSKYRTHMTAGIWLYGETGVGKSYTAFKNYSPDTHYVWKNDNSWQDGYTGQGTVIINDFRGHIPYDELLQMVDKWPYFVPRRGREPAPFLAHTVIITSALPPEQVYNRRDENDSIEQLRRRFIITHMVGTSGQASIT